MTTHRTTGTARRKGGKGRLFLILLVVCATIGIVVWAHWNHQHAQTAGQDRLQAVATASPIPTNIPSPTDRPVKIVAEIPKQLSDEQRFGLWITEQVLDDPQQWLGKPRIELSDNDRQVFIALILTESSFRQFDEYGSTLDSGIDCDGLAQLCNNPAVCNPSARWNPLENVYCGARYFKDLVEKWDGNYGLAIAEYKGAVNKRPDGRAVPNPEHSVVKDLFAHLSLR